MCDDNTLYRITPKGIAVIAMLDTGLILTTSDARIDKFWDIFEEGMRNAGYVKEGDD